MTYIQEAIKKQWMDHYMLIGKRKNKGFTLIELLIVLAIISLLAGLAVPFYFNSMAKAREAALQHDLILIRKALDDFYTDNDRYPKSLMDLVTGKYLRKIPKDPFTDRNDSWIIEADDSQSDGGISDVHSAAQGKSLSGENYEDW
jgi:general secretion pathway protein G